MGTAAMTQVSKINGNDNCPMPTNVPAASINGIAGKGKPAWSSATQTKITVYPWSIKNCRKSIIASSTRVMMNQTNVLWGSVKAEARQPLKIVK